MIRKNSGQVKPGRGGEQRTLFKGVFVIYLKWINSKNKQRESA
jgi:hypothetical protein